MFQNVCRRLNEFEWKEVLNVTDDFVVLPFDPRRELDQKADLKAFLPPERIQSLIDRGYISKMKIK